LVTDLLEFIYNYKWRIPSSIRCCKNYLASHTPWNNFSCLPVCFLIISVRKGSERKGWWGQNYDVPRGHTRNHHVS
jgi:hypothetical protein